jgi:MFS family permease
MAMAYRRLFRNRAFMRLLAGETISSVGDWLYLVAVIVVVYQVTEDPLVLGIVGAVRMIPFVVLSVPAGIVADRYDRRTILLVTDVARGLLMLVLAALVAAEAPVWTIVAGAVAAACCSTFFGPTIGAYLPAVVGDERDLGPPTACGRRWTTSPTSSARRWRGCSSRRAAWWRRSCSTRCRSRSWRWCS